MYLYRQVDFRPPIIWVDYASVCWGLTPTGTMASDDVCWPRATELERATRRQTRLAVGFHFAKDEKEEVGGAVAEVGRAM